MVFVFSVILLIFVVGLIISKKSIRHVFMSGLRFILIGLAGLALIIWVLWMRGNSDRNNPAAEISSYDHSAYLKAEQNKKTEAEKVKRELFAVVRTMFHNETCFRAWNEPLKLIGEIYRKYEDEFEWKDISSLELLVLVDNGFAEAGGNEVVIFNRESSRLLAEKIYSQKPEIPRKRNDAVRKTTVPLSEYYYGPYSESKKYEIYGCKASGYLAVVIPCQSQLTEARKLLDYRRKLEGEELSKYNGLYDSYKKCEPDGLYKKQLSQN
jgi:hypothetical protein